MLYEVLCGVKKKKKKKKRTFPYRKSKTPRSDEWGSGRKGSAYAGMRVEDARRESVLTVLCLHCVCCTSLSEIAAHLPAFKKEEFKAVHPQLAAAVDQLPDAIFGDRAPATVQKYAGAFD